MPDSLECIISKLSGKENGGAYCASCGKYHTEDNPHGMGLDDAGDGVEASEPVQVNQFPDTTQQTTEDEDSFIDNEYVLPEMGKTTNDSTVGSEYEESDVDNKSENDNTIDVNPNNTEWTSDSTVEGNEYDAPTVESPSENDTTVDGSNPDKDGWTSDRAVEEGINDITDQIFPPKMEDEEDFIQGPYHKEEQKFIPELDSNNIDSQDPERDSSITMLQKPASMGELENRGDMDNDFDLGTEDDGLAEQTEDAHLKQAINHLNQAYHAHLEESVDDTEEKEKDVDDAAEPQLDSFATETGMVGQDPIPKHGNYHLDGYPAEIEEDKVYSQGYWPDPNAEVGSFYPQVKHISALDKLIASLSDSDQDVLNTFPDKESASESHFATERKGVVNFAGNTCTECGSYFSNSESRFFEAHIKAHEAEYKKELDDFLKDDKDEADEEDYPWSKCHSDAMKEYGDSDTADKVCGSIKAKSGESVQESEESRLSNILFKKPLNRLSSTEQSFIYDYVSEQNKTQSDIQQAVEIAREAIKKMDAVKEYDSETFMAKENARIEAGVDNMRVKPKKKVTENSKKKVN